MERIIVYLYIIFIITFSFLPKFVETIGFVLFIFSSAYYVWLKRKTIENTVILTAEMKKLKNNFRLFLYVASFYFVISFLNLPKLWDIKGLGYDISYLPRHFFVIAEFFIPILLGYGLFRLKFYSHIHVFKLIIVYILIFMIIHEICVNGLLLVILTLIAWKYNSKLIMLLAFFDNTEQSSYILGFMAMMFFLFFEKIISSFLYKNTKKKIIALMIVALIVFISFSGMIMLYVEDDANSLWRLNVWIDEISTLSQTFFTGVGFGSAYVTENIISLVDNTNMYYDNKDGALETGVFLVANHSSILNMFYRMGLIGGLLFLTLITQLICLVVKAYKIADKQLGGLLWRLFAVFIYQTIVISLNPGLEMMQFAMSYLLCVSFLLAVIFEIHYQSLCVNHYR